MKFRIAFLALGLALVGATLAVAADVSGKWTAQVPGRGGQMNESTFTFKVDGDKLTGTVSGRQGEIPISDGKVSGDDISFTTTVSRGGNEFKVNYKGKISGDEIRFTRVREGGQGQPAEFTAKRVK
ncbi:MAG: hypothetical protein DMG07_23920 [Acidobacteria bacterium]|nr:MAG: hypothetical protein DMG07_23920 [Acidobacteriota bacterium]